MTCTLLIAIGLAGVICFNLWSNRHVGWLTLDRPFGLYSLFFLCYYLLPFIICERTGMVPDGQLVRIIALFAGAYIGFILPTCVLRPVPIHISGRHLSLAHQRALFVLSLLCMALTAYMYSWRIENGIFFNQARYYEQELTVSASIRDVFIGGLQLPVILFLAAVASGSHERLARLGRTTMWAYGLILGSILVLSSQTRPAITAMILLLVGMNTYSRFQIRAKHLVISVLAATSAVVVVQGIRVTGAERLSSSENQLTAALEIMKDLSHTSAGVSREIWQRSLDRASGNVVFLSEIMQARDAGAPNLLGSGIAESLYSIVPRAVWPNKPVVMPGQLVFEQKLGLEKNDAALTLVNQLYAEGGWFAVLVGHFVLGTLLRCLGPIAAKSQSGSAHVIVACIWVSILQIENDAIISGLTNLRNALVICASVWLLAKVCRSSGVPFRIGQATARARI